jgi:hypothetical protein
MLKSEREYLKAFAAHRTGPSAPPARIGGSWLAHDSANLLQACLTGRIAMRALGTFGPLVGLAAILASFAGMYVAVGKVPPDEFVWLAQSIQGLFILYWIILDARRRRRIPCHDFGFLVAIFLPVSLGWYLLWTRGLKGLLLLLAFAILVVAPQLSATIVWSLR